MDYMMDIIKKRISIRSYLDKALPENVIDSIMEAAKNAPSARNSQQLQYRVVTNPELIKRLSDHAKVVMQKEMTSLPKPSGTLPPPRPSIFYSAPLLIIVTGPRPDPWIESDAALAAQNIMLYAASIDLGSCFIGMAKLLEKDLDVLKELHIGSDQKIAASVVVGYPDESPEPKEKFLKAEYFR